MKRINLTKIFMLIAAMLIATNAYGQATIYALNSTTSNHSERCYILYKFQTNSPSTPTETYELYGSPDKYGSYNVLKAGVCINDTLYARNHYSILYYDFTTYKPGKIGNWYDDISSIGNLTQMTYDCKTRDFYIIKDGTELLKINMASKSIVSDNTFKTASGDEIEMKAIACSLEGDLYGISDIGYFYKVNPTSAQCQLIGKTGIAVQNCSMDFDRTTGILYWYNSYDQKLYTINTETAQATSLGKPPYDTQSIFIPFPYRSADIKGEAPGMVLNRQAAPDMSDVTLTWTNPSTDVQGNPLTDLTGVMIFRDGNYLTTIAMTADNIGREMTYTDTSVSNGIHKYRFLPVNSQGSGNSDKDDIEACVGLNPPGMVTNLNVSENNGEVKLSWTAPTEGLYGGYFDQSSITNYKITIKSLSSRYEKIHIVKTGGSKPSYVLSQEYGLGLLSYAVSAVNSVGEGPKCDFSEPIWVKPDNYIFMHTGEVIVDNDQTYTFIDYDGEYSPYYSPGHSDALTFRPADPNRIIKVEFGMIGVWPPLFIFNGDAVDFDNPKNLIGRLTTPQGQFSKISWVYSTSFKSPDGPVTFFFNADDSVSGVYGWRAFVSAVERKDYDLMAGRLLGPYKEDRNYELNVHRGGAYTYTVPVYNIGKSSVEEGSYKVQFLRGNSVYVTYPGSALAPNQSINYTANIPVEISYTDIQAKVIFSKDEDESNNSSNVLTPMAGNKQGITDGVDEVETPQITVYPNPASNMINIAGADVRKAELYNAAGLMVTCGNSQTLNVKHLPTGIYYLRITDASGSVQTLKVVKQ